MGPAMRYKAQPFLGPFRVDRQPNRSARNDRIPYRKVPIRFS